MYVYFNSVGNEKDNKTMSKYDFSVLNLYLDHTCSFHFIFQPMRRFAKKSLISFPVKYFSEKHKLNDGILAAKLM